MTPHPFENEFSEQEAAKIKAEQESANYEQELTDEDMEQVAGGSKLPITDRITWGLNETGEGGISQAIIETGGLDA